MCDHGNDMEKGEWCVIMFSRASGSRLGAASLCQSSVGHLYRSPSVGVWDRASALCFPCVGLSNFIGERKIDQGRKRVNSGDVRVS
jgi:hypothetical protein